jgi:hypothetical protein
MESIHDWKSTVDPNSGRTYWYHRKTRVSTWVRPNFKEDAEANLSPDLNIEQKKVRYKELYVNLSSQDHKLADIGDAANVVKELSVECISLKNPKDLKADVALCLWRMSCRPEIYLSSFESNLQWALIPDSISGDTADSYLVLILCLFFCNMNSGPFHSITRKSNLNRLIEVSSFFELFPFSGPVIYFLKNQLNRFTFNSLGRLVGAGDVLAAHSLLAISNIFLRYL